MPDHSRSRRQKRPASKLRDPEAEASKKRHKRLATSRVRRAEPPRRNESVRESKDLSNFNDAAKRSVETAAVAKGLCNEKRRALGIPCVPKKPWLDGRKTFTLPVQSYLLSLAAAIVRKDVHRNATNGSQKVCQ